MCGEGFTDDVMRMRGDEERYDGERTGRLRELNRTLTTRLRAEVAALARGR